MFKVESTNDSYCPVRLIILESGDDPRRSINLTQGQVEHLRAELLRMLDYQHARDVTAYSAVSADILSGFRAIETNP